MVPEFTDVLAGNGPAREAAGAAGSRHSLRPLFLGERFCKNSGPSRRGNADAYPPGCFENRINIRRRPGRASAASAIRDPYPPTSVVTPGWAHSQPINTHQWLWVPANQAV